MASLTTRGSKDTSLVPVVLLLALLLVARGSDGAAAFSGLDTFRGPGEAEAFEAALLRQACFNVSSSSSSSSSHGCVSRLDTARGGSGSGPVPVLRAALRGALGEAVGAAEAVAGLASLSNHAREEMAVRDCVELLGYSADELGWSLDAMADDVSAVDAGTEEKEQHERARSAASVAAEESLHAWLSAALGNQDTCVQGFHGTDDGRLLRRVEASVARLTQLVSNLLAMHKRLRSIMPLHQQQHGKNNTADELPPWVTDDSVADEELARAHGGSSGKKKKTMRVDVVVAQDGSGRYRTVGEAVARAPSHSRRRYVIYVKRGVYHENVDVTKKKTNLALVGEGMGETVISASRSFSSGWTTFRSATVAVSGAGFLARDLTVRNAAGPGARQAVALRVDSDRSAFYRVALEGHQDTLYAHSLRQFYRDCRVSGTVDFVFGNAAAVIQRTLLATLPLAPGQTAGTVTAQGRKDPNQSTGFALHNCVVQAQHPTYLGRPWRPFSRVVVMESYLGPGVRPQGWLEWAGNAGLGTLFYGEYRNFGPGAGVGGRVRWPGYHVIFDPAWAGRFTVRRFIDGIAWLPSTGVTFTADLIKK